MARKAWGHQRLSGPRRGGGAIGTGVGAYQFVKKPSVEGGLSTAFSATSTAFLVAPNPVTGALVVGTGVAYVGYEVYKHREEIARAATQAWNAAGDAVGAVSRTVRDNPAVLAGPVGLGAAEVWEHRDDIARTVEAGWEGAQEQVGAALDAGGKMLKGAGEKLGDAASAINPFD